MTATSLAIALAAVLFLLAQSLYMVLNGSASPGARYGLLGGLLGFATTAAGALPALFLRSIPQRLEDAMLGFAAGMMLAASAFSLLLPGLDAARELTGSGGLAAAIVVFGMLLGVLLMLGLDEFTPMSTTKPGHAAQVTITARGSGCLSSPSRYTICPREWPSVSVSLRATCPWACR